ncbi:N-glycosylase/DNA lyase [Cocos nucifera]|uniref:N-glycosylase/DNA lyase n=1 Tax=Cocos nucifera TaxID=13894 RepID=A0A8K0I0V5_COCNU|nr:N-glycosylase/DNA lyase [Cocos nucifera]
MWREEATGGQADRSTGVVHLQLPLNDPSFNLETAVCSHGLFMMAPNRWDPASKSLHRPLRLSTSSSLSVRISHPSPSHPLLLVSVFGASSLCSQDQHAILAQVRRMLRISDENDRVIKEFHKLHAGAKERGFGRVFRSPTLFEDMVKCILLCNCQWPRTLSMARSLCELQLELKLCTSREDFHPKTPEPRELKRRHGKKKKIIVKLETKLIQDEAELAEGANSEINHDNQPNNLQGKETPSSTPSMEETSNSCVEETSNKLSTVSTPLYDLSGDMSCPSKQIGDFPSPEELAMVDVDYLAMRCKLGYRAQRIVSLAQHIVECKLQLRKLEEACGGFTLSRYAELDKELSGICGFGPFTCANVLMCMGFYHKIPADTETIRHLKKFHAISSTIHSVKKDVESIYGKYAPFQFLAYWFELWDDYEKIFGKTSEMLPSDYRLITSTNIKSKLSKKRKTDG